jgi:hypothetical protein
VKELATSFYSSKEQYYRQYRIGIQTRSRLLKTFLWPLRIFLLCKGCTQWQLVLLVSQGPYPKSNFWRATFLRAHIECELTIKSLYPRNRHFQSTRRLSKPQCRIQLWEVSVHSTTYTYHYLGRILLTDRTYRQQLDNLRYRSSNDRAGRVPLYF